jgi:WXG100 family type VII secretion target
MSHATTASSHGASTYGQGEGTLTRGAALVEDARAELTATNARLTDQLGTLRAGWHGRGASSFFVLHQAWSERQESVVRALDDLARSLTVTERTNEATDEQQDASYARLVGRLT